jgi:pimeloyl-ACP methyl ester carboxylesterase
MQSFLAGDGLRLAYHEWGISNPGRPVLLHHGFIASARSNWEATGFVAAMLEAHRRVIGIDARGHGESDKPHDPARYGERRMSADLSELADHLGLGRFDLVGYSMGAVVSLVTASQDPRVARMVIGGVGGGIVGSGGVDRRVLDPEHLAAALEAGDVSQIADPMAKQFRRFADSVGGDRLAYAAQARAVNRSGIALDRISATTLIFAGTSDDLATGVERLAARVAGAQLVLVDGDHLSALTPSTARLVVEFLERPL